ncbi:MAG: hypothetical protein IJ742_03220 [Prevotella sp.]|nr:hypothetical protein [Prevotella sp.]
MEESKDQHALPMVAVYLLGHCVGDIEEPVIYVNHQAYDYDDKLVTKGIPNAFVDSLTHDSIIVQIPRLHGKINNRLDEVLSIFDQTYKNGSNQHMLDLDDSCYAEDDVEMQRILRRLLIAAADVDMRMDMNVEDEYYSIIEKQDTDILMKTRELAEKSAQLNEKTAQLNKKTAQLNEVNSQLNEVNSQLNEVNSQLNEVNSQLNEVNSQLNEVNSQLAQQQDNNRKLVKLLLATGMSIDDIAKTTGLTPEEINSM